MSKLLIKNMVCRRCVLSVEEILSKLGIDFRSVVLGEIETDHDLGREELRALAAELERLGFEIIDSRTGALIEKVKKAILEYIERELGNDKRKNLSSFISDRVNYEYSYVSDLFSSVEGLTVEQYFILQRVEKVKELIVYGQQTLSEIAYELGFSSVHHLSAQFKKTTGLTPSHFKKFGAGKRRPLG